ncbi:MAG: hypothetical protein AAB224_03635 [Gemmatimonadota bacterium]
MPVLRTWLAAREPAAPEALRARIARLVGEHPEWEALPLPEALLAAGEVLLGHVLAAPARNRTTAVDLLAADACVTYAFEAAADDPDRLVALAEGAITRIVSLAGQV